MFSYLNALRVQMEKKAQIWVETVVYTLIGLVILGIVLALVRPKIAEIKDKIIIEQTIEALNNLHSTMIEVMIKGEDNIRINDFTIKRGQLKIDSANEKIIFEIADSEIVYSEPNKETMIGDISVLTQETQKKPKIILTLTYSDIDLTYNNENIEKIFQKAPSPYKFSIENKGFTENKVNIDIREVS